MSEWTKKTRGWSHIWTHPAVERAIVDGRGFGLNPGIYWNGIEFPSLKAAKIHALNSQVSA